VVCVNDGRADKGLRLAKSRAEVQEIGLRDLAAIQFRFEEVKMRDRAVADAAGNKWVRRRGNCGQQCENKHGTLDFMDSSRARRCSMLHGFPRMEMFNNHVDEANSQTKVTDYELNSRL
jgi:hypothetical protein